MLSKFTAVDFDGTIFENAWPGIGAPIPEVIEKLKEKQRNGEKIGLNTCREGAMLISAVHACRDQGLYFDCVNSNLPERIEFFHTDPRKIGADEYWDDRAVNVESIIHQAPAWTAVEDGLPKENLDTGFSNFVMVNTVNNETGEDAFIGMAALGHGRWNDGENHINLEYDLDCRITHWMPLPAKPKKEDK